MSLLFAAWWVFTSSGLHTTTEAQPLHRNDKYWVNIKFWTWVIKIYIMKLNVCSSRTLRIMQSGLNKHWDSWYIPTPRKWLIINRQDKIPRLSIAHLSGAFLILFAGYVLSLIAFIYEKIKSVIICKTRVEKVIQLWFGPIFGIHFELT